MDSIHGPTYVGFRYIPQRNLGDFCYYQIFFISLSYDKRIYNVRSIRNRIIFRRQIYREKVKKII